MSDLARAPLWAIRAQQASAIGYAVASLVVDDLSVLSLWTILLTLLSVAVLQLQAALLPNLLSLRAVEPFDVSLQRFRRVYLWSLGGSTVQFGFLTLLWLSALVSPDDTDAFNVGTFAMVLVAWSFSLYASFRVLVTFVVALQQPRDLPVRAELREWLLRSALAGGLFALLNVAESVRGQDVAKALAWPDVVPLALFALVAGLDAVVPLLIRRALARVP
ncbi:hypothetical protein [Deinococcus yavapaiensis]|uniref:Uncharacterized protein n=1 Tax=Deinococcus yavapaiensis KR-236 TaxID=694435 RepID=A0A318S929_9DEIO|nr:hypothetical protein [Deinococcus yavapaiensis]PYE53531.1 hypothetical protein DES52_10860 [Deinococcus yavapaiensis KR-236]